MTSCRMNGRLEMVAAAVTVVAALEWGVGATGAGPAGASALGASAVVQPCAIDAAYAGPPRRNVPPDLWSRVSDRPIDQELPAAIQEALDGVASGFLGRAPAVSVAVAIPGQGRWSAARGTARTDPPAPLPDTVRFQAASTTKTFTAAVIMALEVEGRLSLAQTIDRWFPDAPNAAVTTIDHLLRHTNGLVSFNALPSWTLDFRPPRDAIAMATAERPQFCPGTNFAYTNTGYAMLGVIIEAVEARPLHEVFRDRFVTPLGLEHTSLRYQGDDELVATGHLGGTPVEMPDGYATPFASGSLASTADDLVTFWHAFLGGRVVAPEVARSMFTDLAPMDPGGQMFYGRGVQLYDIPQGPGLMLGHSGGITGFTSVVAYVVADDMYVSVIFNDQQVPAEAGLWAVVRAVREVRQAPG